MQETLLKDAEAYNNQQSRLFKKISIVHMHEHFSHMF